MPKPTSINFLDQSAWTHLDGCKPKREGLYHIKYISSNAERLGYWRDLGPWGSGFYAVTEITEENSARQIFRVEPAKFIIPNLYQPVKGEHSIQTEHFSNE